MLPTRYAKAIQGYHQVNMEDRDPTHEMFCNVLYIVCSGLFRCPQSPGTILG